MSVGLEIKTELPQEIEIPVYRTVCASKQARQKSYGFRRIETQLRNELQNPEDFSLVYHSE